jgi:hypothetical protein
LVVEVAAAAIVTDALAGAAAETGFAGDAFAEPDNAAKATSAAPTGTSTDRTDQETRLNVFHHPTP